MWGRNLSEKKPINMQVDICLLNTLCYGSWDYTLFTVSLISEVGVVTLKYVSSYKVSTFLDVDIGHSA